MNQLIITALAFRILGLLQLLWCLNSLLTIVGLLWTGNASGHGMYLPYSIHFVISLLAAYILLKYPEIIAKKLCRDPDLQMSNQNVDTREWLALAVAVIGGVIVFWKVPEYLMWIIQILVSGDVDAGAAFPKGDIKTALVGIVLYLFIGLNLISSRRAVVKFLYRVKDNDTADR